TVATFQSESGESLDAFATRIAKPAIKFTIKHGVEVCGMLAQREQTYAIILTTSGMNAECHIRKSAIPVGFTSMEKTYHTHPGLVHARFLDGDYAMAGYLATWFGLKYQEGRGTERHVKRFDFYRENLLSNL
ncbi:MAG TPA: hypothetical protein VLF15_11700, partial [Pseudoxanthomonas sp.]|nr:hypothetical protein [Pseudoxanthomonas sp.]